MGVERGDAGGASLQRETAERVYECVCTCVYVPARRGEDGRLLLVPGVCVCSVEYGHCQE